MLFRSGSSSGIFPYVLVNGPIAKTLGIDSGAQLVSDAVSVTPQQLLNQPTILTAVIVQSFQDVESAQFMFTDVFRGSEWRQPIETFASAAALNPATGLLDLDDGRYTENTRACYPLEFIPNTLESGIAATPTNIVMLTADAFGVLPPISQLSPEQAMYHFLSGYTARVAGTEKGVTEPQATFSTCFGAPFMPRHPTVYAKMLGEKMARQNVKCWLVNTGWTGGAFGTGSRMPIKATRALLNAALDGSLANVEMRIDPHFKFRVPVAVPGVDGKILNPRDTWADKAAYDAQARKLVSMFRDNFRKFEAHVGQDVLAAAPELAEAAE